MRTDDKKPPVIKPGDDPTLDAMIEDLRRDGQGGDPFYPVGRRFKRRRDAKAAAAARAAAAGGAPMPPARAAAAPVRAATAARRTRLHVAFAVLAAFAVLGGVIALMSVVRRGASPEAASATDGTARARIDAEQMPPRAVSAPPAAQASRAVSAAPGPASAQPEEAAGSSGAAPRAAAGTSATARVPPTVPPLPPKRTAEPILPRAPIRAEASRPAPRAVSSAPAGAPPPKSSADPGPLPPEVF